MRNYLRGLFSDLDGMKLRNHTMVEFLQHFIHLMRANDFKGSRLETSEGVGVRFLGESHI
jgi:ribosomal protein L5